ncbi:CHC2 zinc finger domain-containing protein [Pseudoblastomonas halimionae]|uniref:Zinc finger CHC2-type domain-containing protein n=1 Tax=Alteriqipengyuania halimionae TaxID=1926630 RepID=A0A6I4U164_9SPHN|nr:CHC2 zinc finger domain-containing protein [Alteriqipengyuania halimionae]MXP09628.1 hypothetical protein [Alteriqipengyuania halimionae]
MGAREDTARLNGLSVQTVGALLGINLPASGMARCPFEGHEDSTPSFEVKRDGRRWICYGCNEHGGAIDLVKIYYGISFLEAKRWLAEKSGFANRSWRRDTQLGTPHSANSTTPQHQRLPEAAEEPPDHRLYQALLELAPLQTHGKDYLQGRGLADDIIERFSIGQMPSVKIFDQLTAEFDFTRIEVAGLFTKSSKRGRYRPIFPENALLFPYLEGGRIVYFQARILHEDLRGGRWRNLNHRRRRIYNSDVLADDNIRRVAICEGAIDVLSATQLGCEAIGLIGVTAGLTKDEATALRRRQVDILLDWDAAGERRAVTLRKELARFGVAATRKSAPTCGAKDINEYLQGGATRI